MINIPRYVALLGGTSYDPSAIAYFAAMNVQPSAAAKSLINTFIVGDKADGSWAKTRMLIIDVGTEQAGLLNMITPSETAINTNGCTYTSLFGWTGDGVSKYIDMGRTFGDGSIATLNDTHLGVDCNQQNGANTLMPQMGAASVSLDVVINARGDGANETYRVNDVTNSTSRIGLTRVGHRTVTRPDSATKKSYFNGSPSNTSSIASVAVGIGNASLLRSNTVYCPDRVDCGYWGASLTDAQVLGRVNRVTTLLTGLRAL